MNSALRVRIAAKTFETQDICSFELVDPQEAALPQFSAGAHIDVHLGDSLVRQYSLANDALETHRYLIAVLLEPRSRGGARAMHALRPGQDLLISAPKNHFPLNDTARHSILFAGGIGITPILAMAHSLARAGGSFELHYCTRSAQRTAFVDRIRASTFSDRVSFHHDDAPPPSRLDIANTVGAPGVGTHLYVCGPAGFMDTVLGTARTNGWAESALHREYFANEAPAKRGATAFEVQIASTGTVIRVAPEQSVVQALHSAGIALPVSCEQGVCGTCITGVLDGVLEHRDMFLTPEEHARGDRFTPCCSRAKSPRLVLDL